MRAYTREGMLRYEMEEEEEDDDELGDDDEEETEAVPADLEVGRRGDTPGSPRRRGGHRGIGVTARP